jgi:hypothetical protein
MALLSRSEISPSVFYDGAAFEIDAATKPGGYHIGGEGSLPPPAAVSKSAAEVSRRGLPEELRWYLANLRKAYPKLDPHSLQNMAAISSSALGSFNRAARVTVSPMFGEFHPPSLGYNRAYFQDVSEVLEGRFTTLYMCGRNNVTIGVGCNLDLNGPGTGLAEAQKLAFYPSKNHKDPDPGSKPVDARAIEAEYNTVRMLNGKTTSADRQAQFLNLAVRQDAVDELFQTRLKDRSEKLLRDTIYRAQWRFFPSSAKMALLSISWAKWLPSDAIHQAVKQFDFLAASKAIQYPSVVSSAYDNLQLRGAWQKILFEYAFAEIYPWTGPAPSDPGYRRNA